MEPYAAKGLTPARVVLVYRKQLKVLSHRGEHWARTGGSLLHKAYSVEELPAVGDWVAARIPENGEALVHAVLAQAQRLHSQGAGRERRPSRLGGQHRHGAGGDGPRHRLQPPPPRALPDPGLGEQGHARRGAQQERRGHRARSPARRPPGPSPATRPSRGQRAGRRGPGAARLAPALRARRWRSWAARASASRRWSTTWWAQKVMETGTVQRRRARPAHHLQARALAAAHRRRHHRHARAARGADVGGARWAGEYLR